jgi:hypothetical protein
MIELRLLTAFGTVPAEAQDGIREAVEAAIRAVAGEMGDLRQVRAVLTESDEQCVFTVELDGRKATAPLLLDLELLEDAGTVPARAADVRQELRAYFRRVLGG